MRMRKKKHGAERLSTLSDLLCKDKTDIGENGQKPFLTAAPLRLEIGCGKGDFIGELSLRESEFNYYAMEKASDVITLAVEKYVKRRALGELEQGRWKTSAGYINIGEKWDIPAGERGNVRFINGDAANICDLFPENVFESIYVNFCDPWSKKGYASRRLTHKDYLDKFIRLLTDGGYFRFKTDNEALFNYSLETVAESGFEIVFKTDDLHASERKEQNIVTEYERNFSEQGIKIHALEAKIT